MESNKIIPSHSPSYLESPPLPVYHQPKLLSLCGSGSMEISRFNKE